jgi:hypothetical protein
LGDRTSRAEEICHGVIANHIKVPAAGGGARLGTLATCYEPALPMLVI